MAMCHSYDRMLQRCENTREQEIWNGILARIKDGLPSSLKELAIGEWRVVHPSGQLLLVGGKPQSFFLGSSQPKETHNTIERAKLKAMLDKAHNEEMMAQENKEKLAKQDRIKRGGKARSQRVQEGKQAKLAVQEVQIMSVLEAVPTMRVPMETLKRKVMGKHAFTYNTDEEYFAVYDEFMDTLEHLVEKGSIKQGNNLYWVEG